MGQGCPTARQSLGRAEQERCLSPHSPLAVFEHACPAASREVLREPAQQESRSAGPAVAARLEMHSLVACRMRLLSLSPRSSTPAEPSIQPAKTRAITAADGRRGTQARRNPSILDCEAGAPARLSCSSIQRHDRRLTMRAFVRRGAEEQHSLQCRSPWLLRISLCESCRCLSYALALALL